jgi:magnesium transporter
MSTVGSAPKKIKSLWRRQTPPGALPGTIDVDPAAPSTILTVFAYGPQGYVEKIVINPQSLRDYLREWPVTWVNIEGLGSAAIIHELGEIFGLHRLALEDVIHVHQRPKVEEYGPHLFIVARMMYLSEQIESEQLSMFLGEKFLLTFQTAVGGDCLGPVRERIRQGTGRIRHAGADYLAYSLLDSVVDAYFPVLDIYSNELDALEDEVIERPVPKTLARVHAVKRNLLMLRRVVWPLREAVSMLIREPSSLIAHDTQIYLRDCYDHTIQILDLLETHRELSSSLMDVYLSSVSNRMNEIVKVLTIISTIFIPLSFFAGIYGMNFNTDHPLNMPELNLPYGYPLVLTLMAVAAGSMLAYFWRKGWLNRAAPIAREEEGPEEE